MRQFLLFITLCFLQVTLSGQEISVTLMPNQGATIDDIVSICQGENIEFSAIVDYGATGGTDDTSLFQWIVTGQEYDASAGMSQRTVNYDYASGGYVTLTVVEPTSGAIASATLEVEVAGAPDFQSLLEALPGVAYLGEPMDVEVSLDEGQPGYLSGFEGTYLSGGIEQTITFLPDGSGVSYETAIIITGAPDGATINETNVLRSIWGSLEHSYLGDLDIETTCPSGQIVLLQEQGGGSCNLGTPWATGAVDGESANVTPGQGMLYHWSVDGEVSLEDGCAPDLEFTSGDGPDTYTDSQTPGGSYSPDGSLADLDGCPINGEWIMTITDNIGADNGYIFCWGLEFEGDIVPNNGVYSTELLSLSWTEDPAIVSSQGGAMSMLPQETGQQLFYLTATDELGCTHELEYPVDVYDANGLVEVSSDASLEVLVANRLISINSISPEGVLWQSVLFDELGRVVNQTSFRDYSSIDVPSAGFYLLRSTDSNGQRSVRKLVIH